MNKLVYLFELDSVRNTEKEIEIGQHALFEEIIGNGNKVVLTFNQVTDSKAFLCSLEDESNYNCILDLFKMGAIKVSRFCEYRTVSQYIQAAIEKCLAPNADSFLFSGLPVQSNDKILLSNIYDALRYSDPSILVELIKNVQKKIEKEPDNTNVSPALAKLIKEKNV